MLVLTRKKDQTVVIPAANITITVVAIRGDKVRLGIEAPSDIGIHRAEVWAAMQARAQKDDSDAG